MKKIFLIILLLALIFGCTTLPPIKNPQNTELNLPSQCRIDGIKPIKQDDNGCVPACLKMVFKFYGKELDKNIIADWIQRGYGTTPQDLEQFVRWNGFNVFSFSDWRPDKRKIKYFISQGYPVLVGGQVRLEDENHLIILIEYDDLKIVKIGGIEFKGYFLVCDPGIGNNIIFPYKLFNEFHSSKFNPYYGVVIYPKRDGFRGGSTPGRGEFSRSAKDN